MRSHAWLLLLLLAACVREVRRAPPGTTDEGTASFYGKAFAGRATASGELFDPSALTAAHRTLPFDSCVRVELISTRKSVQVRINDRGPFIAGRLIDLSEGAAAKIGLTTDGVGRVRLTPCQ